MLRNNPSAFPYCNPACLFCSPRVHFYSPSTSVEPKGIPAAATKIKYQPQSKDHPASMEKTISPRELLTIISHRVQPTQAAKAGAPSQPRSVQPPLPIRPVQRREQTLPTAPASTPPARPQAKATRPQLPSWRR